ncbi:carbon-nitrogen hydrolase family protein [Planctomycetota bacterium]
MNPLIVFLVRARRWCILALLILFIFNASPSAGCFWTGLLFLALGTGLRFWAAGHEADMTGPYSIVQTPLAFGSYLFGIGCLLSGGTWMLLVIFLLSFPLIYHARIRIDEAKSGEGQAPDEAEKHYREEVPIFFPAPWKYRPPAQQWDGGTALFQAREYHFLLGIVLLFVILIFAASMASPERPPSVKVAAIQFVSEFNQPERNREALEMLIREAIAEGAHIIVLPETAVQGYMSHDLLTAWQAEGMTIQPEIGGRPRAGLDPAGIAEEIPGKSTSFFGRLALEYSIYVTVPLLEIDRKTGRYFNSVVLMDPHGHIRLHYRKLNPWMPGEQGWAQHGDRGHAYADTEFGRLGLLICYDINFEPPALQKAGIDILLYPIAWVDGKDSDWFTDRLPAIARKNNLNIVGANWSVTETPWWHGYGKSCIISNKGEVLATVGNDLGNEIIYAEIGVNVISDK